MANQFTTPAESTPEKLKDEPTTVHRFVRRLLDWLFPSRICKRTEEHDDGEFWRLIMKPCSRYGAVAETYRVFRYRCKRCGRKTEEFHREEFEDSYTGVSMPSDQMRLMEKRGWIYWD